MNEYTRREEVRWTLVASLALVVCLTPAVFLLATARGGLVPDPAAQATAKAAADRSAVAHVCAVAAGKLVTEVDVFKASARAAHLDADAPEATVAPKRKPGSPRSKPPPKNSEPDLALAWPAALPSHKHAKTLAPCRSPVEGAVGVRPAAAPAWDAIAKVAEIAAPSADPNEQIAAARAVLKLLGTAPVEEVAKAASEADAAQKKTASDAQAAAERATVREELPKHVLDRGVAIGVGAALSLLTMLLNYLAVRVASARRLTTLVPLREAVKAGQPGAHAAAILRIAAQPNSGQPGMVIGTAVGSLLAATLVPADTDIFIAGVMGGCVLGLGMQVVLRAAQGASRWRQRAADLADIEKPAIPIVLVLSGVNPGLEVTFLQFLSGLSPRDAATAVEKLATQAEEKILAAADAGAEARLDPSSTR